MGYDPSNIIFLEAFKVRDIKLYFLFDLQLCIIPERLSQLCYAKRF